jgi:hypothetical protein
MPARLTVPITLAVSLVALGLIAITGAPAAACPPPAELTVVPNDDLISGETVMIRGSGFDPEVDVALSYNHPATGTEFALTTTPTDATGSFESAWVIPGDIPTGPANIVAVGPTDCVAGANISLACPTGPAVAVNPDSGMAGDVLEFVGAHFTAGVDVTLLITDDEGIPVPGLGPALVPADDGGTVRGTFMITDDGGWAGAGG